MKDHSKDLLYQRSKACSIWFVGDDSNPELLLTRQRPVIATSYENLLYVLDHKDHEVLPLNTEDLITLRIN